MKHNFHFLLFLVFFYSFISFAYFYSTNTAATTTNLAFTQVFKQRKQKQIVTTLFKKPPILYVRIAEEKVIEILSSAASHEFQHNIQLSTRSCEIRIVDQNRQNIHFKMMYLFKKGLPV